MFPFLKVLTIKLETRNVNAAFLFPFLIGKVLTRDWKGKQSLSKEYAGNWFPSLIGKVLTILTIKNINKYACFYSL